MGLFSCCLNDKQQTQHDPEARHARIVSVYAQNADDLRSSTRAPPPAYSDIIRGEELPTTVTLLEKEPCQPPIHPIPPIPPAPQQMSPVLSPCTSIYSVPSTRLTDITSAHTGVTSVTVGYQQTGESLRSSLVFDSAPPSYYDGRSMRERSPSPHMQRQPEDQVQAFTLTDDWLEILQRTANLAEAHLRQLERR